MNRLIAFLLLALTACAPIPDAVPPVEPEHPFGDPGNRPHPERVPDFDIEHYKIEVTLDPGKRQISATTTLTIKASGAEFDSSVELDSVGLAYSSVTLNGREAKWSVGGERLTVLTGRETSVTIGATYTATPKHGLWWAGTPPMIWSQGETEYNRHWFPCWAAPNDKATSEVIAHVPAGMTAVSNGALVEQRDGRWHWKQTKPGPSYLISIVVGDFERIEIAPTVDVYVPRGEHAAADVRRTFAPTPAMIAFISEKTGVPYPWAKYAQVVVKEFIWGGMENTSCTTLYEDAIVPAKLAGERDMDDLIVHELAHQWFGNYVTCRTWSEIWLNEGWATYWEALWAERTEGEAGRARVLAEYAEDALEKDRPVVTDCYTHPDDMFDSVSYQKGGWILHMLRGVVGEEAWWKGVRKYLERHALEPVETKDLRRAMEEACGQNLGWFFNQWTTRGGAPEFDIQSSWDAATKSLRIAIGMKGEFRIPAEIDVITTKGTRSVRLTIEKPQTDLYLALDEKPTVIEFDPRGWILKSVAWRKTPDELIAQLERGGLLGQAWAAEQLEESPDPVAVPALKKAMGSASALVRGAAARALAVIDSSALIEAIKSAKARERRTLIEALGRDAERHSVAMELKRLATEDESPLCRAAAWRAYGKHGSGAVAELAEGAKTTDALVLRGVIDGLAAAATEEALGILLQIPSMTDRIAGALGKFKRDTARNRLLQLLSDPRYGVRMAAAESLGEVGDLTCAEVLLMRVDLETDGQLIQAMRKSARKLKP